MARTTDTRARVRELAEELISKGEEPTPTIILRMLGRGSPNTIVDELRRWRETTAKSLQPATHEAAAAIAEHSEVSTLPRLLELLTPLTTAIEGLTRRVDEQDKAHAAETALAYERFHAVQKMAMVAIDEAREQTRFWKQEAERAKLDSAVQVDTYRDAMRSAQGEARRLAELLQLHHDGSGAPPNGARKVPPTPSLASIGKAPTLAAPSVLREHAPREYDPDGHSE